MLLGLAFRRQRAGDAVRQIMATQSSGLLVGVARRFGKNQGWTLYFSIHGEPDFDELDRLKQPLGNTAAGQFRVFYSQVSTEALARARWGWAITLADDGTLRYVKLEATGVNGAFHNSGTLRAAVGLDSYRAR